MNRLITFQSVLAEDMQQFIAFKRMQGYDYSSSAKKLAHFDRFLLNHGAEITEAGLLNQAILQGYIESVSHYQRDPFGTVKEFSRYLHAGKPRSALFPELTKRRKPVPMRFYRIEVEDMPVLLHAATTLHSQSEMRSCCIRMLIGLLYCTGLRVGEALQLKVNDVDWKQSILHVIHGKFNKPRLVALRPGTCNALREYLSVRRKHRPRSSALFINERGNALNYDQAYYSFQKLCRCCSLDGKPPMRLHDLRHNYACHGLERWRKEGRDIHTMLPILATAMGHTKIENTKVYLHVSPVDLQDAADRLPVPITREVSL